MADINIHGIEIVSGGKEIRTIRSPNQAVVGIVGTASSRTTLKAATPEAFTKSKAALAAIFPEGASGEKGSLYDGVAGVFEQGDGVVVVSMAASASNDDVIKAVESLLDAESVTGFKPKIICAPGLGNTIPTVQPSNPPGPSVVSVTESLTAEPTQPSDPVVNRSAANNKK
jgi:phage tail sheath protein FI